MSRPSLTVFKKSVGFTKNCFDLFCIAVTVVIGFLFSGHIVGIGLGTLLAMLGVGRVIALFHRLTYKKIVSLAGLDDTP